jgi:2-polyprenyl-3-methyl-5-hydroxy-6-metoxy-1,4-benzoquinol methylase
MSGYSALTFRDRVHLSIRWLLCPMLRIAEYVPRDGVIVDVGCGHGLFTQLLARQSSARQLIGFDLDAAKIGLAQQLAAASAGLPNVSFRVEDVSQATVPPATAVTILDVFYLVPYAAQEQLLRDCAAKLKSGGVIVLKEIAESPRWKYAANWLEESLMVRVLGLTAGQGQFYFRTRADWQALLGRLGLQVETIAIDRGYYHSHVLFVARKP